MSTPPLVLRTDVDAIAVLTLDSPRNRNALSQALLTQLTEHLSGTERDHSLKGVLLTSSQPVFCSGADLKEAATVDMVEQAGRIIALQRAIAALSLPVVVRLDGPVRAGGLGIVAAADLVVCASDVTFALTEVALGLAAATISLPLRARVQPRALADWLLTARVFSAEEARSAGLVTALAAPDQMEAQVAAVLDQVRAGTRQGLIETKRLLTQGLLADLDTHGEQMARLSGRLFHSEVAQERMAAVLRR